MPGLETENGFTLASVLDRVRHGHRTAPAGSRLCGRRCCSLNRCGVAGSLKGLDHVELLSIIESHGTLHIALSDRRDLRHVSGHRRIIHLDMLLGSFARTLDRTRGFELLS